MSPRVTVVVPTHNRPERLARTLAALRAQSLPADEFEVVVVDDGSGPETGELLERERATAGLDLHVIRHDRSQGPARARNDGWRAARAELVAFTDDDCEPTPGWLAAGLAAWGGRENAFVQGPTSPHPDELAGRGPFSHTLEVDELGPWWETANIFYPRAALELVDGFDEQAFKGPSGEDTDLGWSLIARGWEPVWAADALVHHAVQDLGPRGMLRLAWRWDESMLIFKRHPQLRRHLTARIFWLRRHWLLVRALAALAVPSRFWWVRWWLAAPYVVRLGRHRPDILAFLVVHDLVEMAACARGGLRYRVPVL